MAQEKDNKKLKLEPLPFSFSICKVKDYSQTDLSRPFCFLSSTDEEKSLVCPAELVPDNTIERDDGWRAFRIAGILDFSLIGILAGITKILAEQGIGVFAVSTFNTDYILTREKDFQRALNVLRDSGYEISPGKQI